MDNVYSISYPNSAEYDDKLQPSARTLIANTPIWNVPKKKGTTGVLGNRNRTGQPRNTPAGDNRNIVRAVRKSRQEIVSDVNRNFHRRVL